MKRRAIQPETTTIVRVVKHSKNFTILDNAILKDARLSYRDTGLICMMLSLPDGWRLRSTDLASRKTDGRDSVRAGMRNLVACGYLTIETKRLRNGQFTQVITAYEQPLHNESPGGTEDGFSGAGLPGVGFPGPLISTEDQGPKIKEGQKTPAAERRGETEGTVSNEDWGESTDGAEEKPPRKKASPGPLKPVTECALLFKREWDTVRCQPDMVNLLYYAENDKHLNGCIKWLLEDMGLDRLREAIPNFFRQLEAGQIYIKHNTLINVFMANRGSSYKDSREKAVTVDRVMAGIKRQGIS